MFEGNECNIVSACSGTKHSLVVYIHSDGETSHLGITKLVVPYFLRSSNGLPAGNTRMVDQVHHTAAHWRHMLADAFFHPHYVRHSSEVQSQPFRPRCLDKRRLAEGRGTRESPSILDHLAPHPPPYSIVSSVFSHRW